MRPPPGEPMLKTILSTACALAVSLTLHTTSNAQQSDYHDIEGVPDDIVSAWRFPDIVEALNNISEESVSAVLAEHFTDDFADMPMERHMSVWSQFRERTGPVELIGFRTYDPPQENVVALLRATLVDSYFAISVVPEPAAPHKFAGMRFAPARTPTFVEARPPLEGEALAKQIDSTIDNLLESDMFSGTVAVVHNGDTIYSRSAGLASRRFDVPNTMNTKFNLGSMNKMFTAVAIAILEEQGKLSYDDFVGEHIPDYPNQIVKDKVQIKHLLSHTSGLSSHFTVEFQESSKTRYRSIDDFLESIAEQNPAFDPGTDWAYSNAGFYLLGRIIENTSGESYFDFIREHIYAPAGMTNSDCYDIDLPIKNIATGYTPGGISLDPDDDGTRWLEGRQWTSNVYLHMIKGGPAGGGYSTTPDLLAFADALTSDKLTSKASREHLTSAKPELTSETYGYGFTVRQHPRLGKQFGHNGGFPGINAELRIYPDAGYTVVVMANMDNAATLLATQIESFLAGQ